LEASDIYGAGGPSVAIETAVIEHPTVLILIRATRRSRFNDYWSFLLVLA
jgi:hypothetical protein